jgi:hypothetical protein
MTPRVQTAGTIGIVAGIVLAILFVLFFTSGLTPEMFGDPARMVDYLAKNSARTSVTTLVSLAAVALGIVFTAGLAAKLRDKTPTRAAAVLYFGVLALVGHGLGSVIFGTGGQMVAAYAAKDQVAASHAWVAVAALQGAADGFGGLFYGLSTLMAGWAITTDHALSAALGWFAVVSGAVSVLAFLLPMTGPLFFLSFLLPIVWLIWAGSGLRSAK